MARRKAKKSSSKTAQKRSSQKVTKKPTRQSILTRISPQRRIDITGLILIVVGLLTLISLFAQSTGSLTGWWILSLRKAIGWGVYFIPLLLLVLGLWVLLRNMDRIPNLSVERLTGLAFLVLNLLSWFHLLLDGGFDQAQAGQGGGYVGAAFKILFERLLGRPGAMIALFAWLLVSLILTFDLAMANLLKGLGKFIQRFFGAVSAGIKQIIQTLQRRSSPSLNQTPAAAAPRSPQATGERAKLAPATPGHAPGSSVPHPASGDLSREAQVLEKPVWILPDPAQILEPGVEAPDDSANDRQRANVIEETLRSFGAPSHVVDIRRGPSITLFGIEPDFVNSRNGKMRVRVSKITALADDLALALAASRIRIQAPVPGKGYIGLEVPNREISLVALQDVIQSPAYLTLKSPMKIALGKDVAGNTVAADLTAMPHLLIAGTTGAGKSVCINAILACFLMHKTPDELRLVLVDPKRVELTGYNGIPHLLSPVIVDAAHVVGTLQWVIREMDMRFRKFEESESRNIADFNDHCERLGAKKLPYLLVVIDELADMMMMAPDETEQSITRLAQMARATGIHLIIATQRPSTDIITGVIKANFPARIAFAVASSVDSRVILDQPGAERLLGRGDMLFQAPDAAAPVRIQGAFVSDREINRLAAYWRGFTVSGHAPERPAQSAAFQTSNTIPMRQTPLWEEMAEEKDLDPKFNEAVNIVREEGQASISMLQRKMRIGYTRSARMIEMMADKGIIGEPDPKTQIRQIVETDKNEE